VPYAAIHLFTSRSMRMQGLHVYAAFPKLLMLGLAAVSPALAYAGVRVAAWESRWDMGRGG